MRRGLFGVLLGLMTLMTGVFVLNRRHGPPEVYYGGSPEPVHPDLSGDPLLYQLVPALVTHPCPICGPCIHPVEIVECPRTLSIRDHRRWYQLFHWSDRTYYFDDLVSFAGGFKNRSARNQAGRWEIQARIGPARHEKSLPHDCGSLPTGFRVAYDLVATESPLEETVRDLAPGLAIHDQVQALAFRYETPDRTTVLHFAWRLPPGDVAGAAPAAPCPCARP